MIKGNDKSSPNMTAKQSRLAAYSKSPFLLLRQAPLCFMPQEAQVAPITATKPRRITTTTAMF